MHVAATVVVEDPGPGRAELEARGEDPQAVDHRLDHREDPGAGDRPPDDPPAAVGEVDLELVGVREGQHGEEPDPRPAVAGLVLRRLVERDDDGRRRDRERGGRRRRRPRRGHPWSRPRRPTRPRQGPRVRPAAGGGVRAPARRSSDQRLLDLVLLEVAAPRLRARSACPSARACRHLAVAVGRHPPAHDLERDRLLRVAVRDARRLEREVGRRPLPAHLQLDEQDVVALGEPRGAHARQLAQLELEVVEVHPRAAVAARTGRRHRSRRAFFAS